MTEEFSPEADIELNEQIELKKEEFSDESLLAGLGREKDDDEITTTIKLVGKEAPLSPEEEKTILERLGKTRTAFLLAVLAHPHTKEVHPQVTADTMNLDTANAVYKLLSEKPTTNEKELEVRQAYENYQAVREKLSRHNGRLVIAIAKRYRKLGIGFADLIMDGLPGKMKAIDTFNPEKFKNKFSTYATHLIQGSIVNGIQEKARTIRLPRGVILKLGKMRDAQIQLKQQGEDHRNTERISEISGISVDDVRLLRKVRKNPTSLDILVGEDDGESLGSLLEDKKTNEPTNKLEEGEKLQKISQAEEHVFTNVLTRKRDERTKEVWLLKKQGLHIDEIATQMNIRKQKVQDELSKMKKALSKVPELQEQAQKPRTKKETRKEKRLAAAKEAARERMDKHFQNSWEIWELAKQGVDHAVIAETYNVKMTTIPNIVMTVDGQIRKELKKNGLTEVHSD